MLPKYRYLSVWCLVIFFGLISKVAIAASAGAYSIETEDAAAFGMGTAFVGEADSPAAVYYNPAGINQISSPEVSIGDAILAPRSKMIQPDGNTVHEQNNEYSVPDFYAVVPIIPNKLSIGASSGSNWGLGTNWGYNSPLQYATTVANITDVDDSLVASYQVTEQWSLAAGVDNDYSRVDESYSFSNLLFGSSTPGNVELKGGDDAWGYRLATMYKLNDKNQFGLMYTSRINHEYDGKVTVNGISPGAIGYFGLNGSSIVTDADVKTVLPQSVVLGYSLKATPKWTINTDIKWTDWSSSKYQTITYPNASAQQLAFLTAGGSSTAENWHSSWTEAIGTQYDVTDRFRVRLGYYHIGSPISDANFNPNIPDSNSNGYTTGFGFDITKKLTLDVTYSALVYDSRTIINSVANGTVDGKYEQFVNLGLVSLTYKF